jgi:hypothetical protein
LIMALAHFRFGPGWHGVESTSSTSWPRCGCNSGS